MLSVRMCDKSISHSILLFLYFLQARAELSRAILLVSIIDPQVNMLSRFLVFSTTTQTVHCVCVCRLQAGCSILANLDFEVYLFWCIIFLISLSTNWFSPTSRVPKKLIFLWALIVSPTRRNMYKYSDHVNNYSLDFEYLSHESRCFGEISSSQITLFRAKYLAEIIGSDEVKIIIPLWSEI